MSQLQITAAETVRPAIDDPAERLVPVENYAVRPVPEAFENLDEVLLPELLQLDAPDEAVFDVTAFYSRRRPGLSIEEEQTLDSTNRAAFEAAIGVGGLVLYYQGQPLERETPPNSALGLTFTPNCMSFCVWQSRRQAVTGARLQQHRAAVAGTHTWYEAFGIKKYALTIASSVGRAGVLSFTEYDPMGSPPIHNT
jgi:hypothetical protein